MVKYIVCVLVALLYSEHAFTADIDKKVVQAFVSQDSVQIVSVYDTIMSGRSGHDTREYNWQNVQNALYDEDVAIEFVTIVNENSVSECFAFIQRTSYAYPHLIKMKSLKNIEMKEDNEKRVYEGLYYWFVESLGKELRNVQNIYFVPDYRLSKVSIEYSTNSKGRMLAEKYRMFRLTSTAVLCNKHIKPENNSFLLCGGIDYRTLPEGLKEEKYGGLPHKSNLGYLQDSYTAANGIYSDLSKTHKVDFLCGNTVTEKLFKTKLSSGIKTLLIETHGIFTNEKVITTITNPNDYLMNHALALSSASYVMEGGVLPEGLDDGILTAKEVSELDLHNIDLAVISACKSGLGEIKWDGVHGLLRGFKQAGVNSLVMTLDDVVDYVSGQLWIQFFRNLTNGQSKREALLNGIKYIRTMDNGAFSHPKYWTPFILIDGIE